MGLRITAVALFFGLTMFVGAAPSQAWERWLGNLIGHDDSGSADALPAVVRHITGSKPESGTIDIAAERTDIGHWRLVNREGESFTAATDAELARGLKTLAPDVQAAKARLHVHLTADTALRRAASLASFPVDAELSLVMGGRRFSLVRRTGQPPRVAIGREFLVEAGAREVLAEIVRQIERPVDRALVRILALEPGGSTGLSRAPSTEPGERRARPDVVDPGHLGRAIDRISGQVVLVSGRLDGNRLAFKPASGPEGTLAIGPLTKDAARADVNFLILDTSSPRQPGTRNWLWQRMALSNFDKALGGASLGRFFHALAGDPEKLVISGSAMADGRIEIVLTPFSSKGSAPVANLTRAVAESWADIVSETAGSIAIRGVRASLLTVERQREIDRRIIPGLPSLVQAGYLALLVFGLLALPVVNRWWRCVWPTELETEYAGRGGFALARLVRGIVFATIFLPLVVFPALLVRLVQVMYGLAEGWRAQRRDVAT